MSLVPSKDLQNGSIQDGEVPEVGKAPSVLDGNGLDLSIGRLKKLLF